MKPQTRALEQMLNELESHMLVTILAPSKRSDRREWDQIRVNMDVGAVVITVYK